MFTCVVTMSKGLIFIVCSYIDTFLCDALELVSILINHTYTIRHITEIIRLDRYDSRYAQKKKRKKGDMGAHELQMLLIYTTTYNNRCSFYYNNTAFSKISLK